MSGRAEGIHPGGERIPCPTDWCRQKRYVSDIYKTVKCQSVINAVKDVQPLLGYCVGAEDGRRYQSLLKFSLIFAFLFLPCFRDFFPPCISFIRLLSVRRRHESNWGTGRRRKPLLLPLRSEDCWVVHVHGINWWNTRSENQKQKQLCRISPAELQLYFLMSYIDL